MNKSHLQTHHVHHTIENIWLWMGIGVLILVSALLFNSAAHNPLLIPDTGAPVAAQNMLAQTVPEAAGQGVAGYIAAHSISSGQSVPEAAVQGVAGYLRGHEMTAQAVPETGVQSVLEYLRLHSSKPAGSVDPAVQSVMNYLKAHGVQP